MIQLIRLQLTRIPEVNDFEEVTYTWLVRAYTTEGHGCDCLVTELSPPYTTEYDVSQDGLRQRLRIFADYGLDPIAETIWPMPTVIVEPVVVQSDLV